MNSVRGPQFPVFIEELIEPSEITLETLSFRASTYYISTRYGIFSPRLLFAGHIENLVPLEQEGERREEPIFLQDQGDSDDSRTNMEDVSLPTDPEQRRTNIFTHVAYVSGFTKEAFVLTLINDPTSELRNGDRVLFSAKVFNAQETPEFMDAFLRVESYRILKEEELNQEWRYVLQGLRARRDIISRVENGEIDFFSERNNYILNMHHFSERNITTARVEEFDLLIERVERV